MGALTGKAKAMPARNSGIDRSRPFPPRLQGPLTRVSMRHFGTEGNEANKEHSRCSIRVPARSVEFPEKTPKVLNWFNQRPPLTRIRETETAHPQISQIFTDSENGRRQDGLPESALILKICG